MLVVLEIFQTYVLCHLIVMANLDAWNLSFATETYLVWNFFLYCASKFWASVEMKKIVWFQLIEDIPMKMTTHEVWFESIVGFGRLLLYSNHIGG